MLFWFVLITLDSRPHLDHEFKFFHSWISKAGPVFLRVIGYRPLCYFRVSHVVRKNEVWNTQLHTTFIYYWHSSKRKNASYLSLSLHFHIIHFSGWWPKHIQNVKGTHNRLFGCFLRSFERIVIVVLMWLCCDTVASVPAFGGRHQSGFDVTKVSDCWSFLNPTPGSWACVNATTTSRKQCSPWENRILWGGAADQVSKCFECFLWKLGSLSHSTGDLLTDVCCVCTQLFFDPLSGGLR